MRRGPTGSHQTITTVGSEAMRAFLPSPLPPVPALDVSPDLRARLDAALLSLGRLDSITALLPDAELFLYSYIRKEALLSSQIEGTQSTLSDLLLFEAEDAPGVPLDEVAEVSSYVAALNHGIARIRAGFPMSSRLIREIHAILMSAGRGRDKTPGEFRRSQNWLGGSRPGNARFVPPPPEHVADCMGSLELFLHDADGHTPTLIKAALAHVQFETIHPFLDGNGRVGRLLITLLLTSEGVLQQPILYLSLFLKNRRDEYYSHLESVRDTGDWESWLDFFATGVEETARGAVETVRRLVHTFDEDRARLSALGRVASSALRVHAALQRRPVASAQRIAMETGLAVPTVNVTMARLVEEGMVRELTGRRRGRVYAYDQYLRVLGEGTEPLRS